MAETYLKSLELKSISTISSGTNVDWNNPHEREYFANTLSVLSRHGIRSHAKSHAEQLTQQRLSDSSDVVVLMNQRVIDEAVKIVKLPSKVLNWEIVDIGDGHRTDRASREAYEEEIYLEITQKVDDLVKELA